MYYLLKKTAGMLINLPMNKIDEIFNTNSSLEAFGKEYAKYIGELVRSLDFKEIEKIGLDFLAAREQQKKIIFIGNGGSAATASHFANDFSIGPCVKNPFKAISLTDNMAVITAIANDFGYEDIFTKQLEVILEPGDRVVAISASGNSPNIIKAIDYARKREAKVIGLVGFDGGLLKEKCDYCIHVKTAKGEYGPVEDLHMFIDHLLGSYFIRFLNRN